MLFSRTHALGPALPSPTPYSPQLTQPLLLNSFKDLFQHLLWKGCMWGLLICLWPTLISFSTWNHYSLYTRLKQHITLKHMFNAPSLIWLWSEVWNQLKACFSHVFFFTSASLCVSPQCLCSCVSHYVSPSKCVCVCFIVLLPQHCVSLFSVCVSLSVCVTLSVCVLLRVCLSSWM